MKILRLSFLIFSLAILQTFCYTVTFDCISKCSGCKAACLFYDGGPFNENKLCTTSCTGLYKTETNIGCSFSCSGGCDYSYTAKDLTIKGCATEQDNLWVAIELQFNLAYKAFKLGTSNYNWTGGVCAWSIVGIVVGILGGIGIIIGVIIFIKKRKANRERSLLNSSTDN